MILPQHINVRKGPIIEAANGEVGQVLAVKAAIMCDHIALRSSAIWTLI